MRDSLLLRPGRRGQDGGALSTCVERLCVAARDVGAGDLPSTAKALLLLLCCEAADRPGPSEPGGERAPGGGTPGCE